MYCSPAGDSPDTRTSLETGIGTVDFTLTNGVDTGRRDVKAFHPADRHAAQRHVLIRQQAGGVRQLRR